MNWCPLSQNLLLNGKHRLFFRFSGIGWWDWCGQGKEHFGSTTGGAQTQRSFNRVKSWKADSSRHRRRGTKERTEQEVLYANPQLHKPSLLAKRSPAQWARWPTRRKPTTPPTPPPPSCLPKTSRDWRPSFSRGSHLNRKSPRDSCR